MEASRREQRRYTQRALKQQHILDAAEQVFGSKGYVAASVYEIAELAEFSLSALYRIYESKEALFLAVMDRRGNEIAQELNNILAGQQTHRQKLHQMVDYSISFYHEHPDWGRTYLHMATTAVPYFESEGEAEDYRAPDATDITAQVIREGQSGGEFVSGDPIVLARMLTGMVVTYLSTDPAIMGNESAAGNGLPLEQFHAMIDRTFCCFPQTK